MLAIKRIYSAVKRTSTYTKGGTNIFRGAWAIPPLVVLYTRNDSGGYF